MIPIMKIFLLVSAIPFIVSCSLCEESDVKEMVSPDEKHVARVVVRNCGATADYSTIVSLKNNTSDWLSSDNTTDVLVLKGDLQVEINWGDNEAVNIKCPLCIKDSVFKQESSWSGIKIIFEYER